MCAITWTNKAPRSDAFADFLFRILGIILLRNFFTFWGYHLAGEENFLADFLSRTAHLRVKETLKMLKTETNMPYFHNISIQALPEHITSWIYTTLDAVMREKVPFTPPTKPKSQHGPDGQPLQNILKSATSTSLLTHPQKLIESSSPSSHTHGGSDLEKELLTSLKKLILEKSSHLLGRPSFYEA